MAVNKIEIKKFTVFNDVEISTSSGINVIIGENGTGKTHLLKLVHADKTVRNIINNGPDILLNPKHLPTYILTKVFGMASSDGYIHNLTGNINLERFNQYKADVLSLFAKDASMFEVTVDVTAWRDTIFLPAKEMLSMSKILDIHDKYSVALSLESTYTEIISMALRILPNIPPELSNKIAPILEKIIQGTVFTRDDPKGGSSFWVKKLNGDEIPFSMESEGYRKLGLLWRLIMNESITTDTVLLWDEPEANINPNLVRPMVEILLELARNGVQIFLATHDYFFAKYVEVLSNENDKVAFHGLYKTENGVKCETADKFSLLSHNAIINEKIKLYEEETSKVMGI